MKIPYRWEKSQWIPWEISYSLKRPKRNNNTSDSNAILGVILPDSNNSYDYYNELRLFEILRTNIHNGYIPLVTWKDFRYNSDLYIAKAYDAKKNTSRDELMINF